MSRPTTWEPGTTTPTVSLEFLLVLSVRRAYRENKPGFASHKRRRPANEPRTRAGYTLEHFPPPSRLSSRPASPSSPSSILSSQHSPDPADAEPPATSSPRPRRPIRIHTRLVSDQTTRPDTIALSRPIESGLQLWPPATVMARTRRRPIDSGLCPLRAQTRPSRTMAPGRTEAFGCPIFLHDRPPGPRGPTPISPATLAITSGI